TNATFLPKWNAAELEFKKQKNELWKEAWEKQGNYMTWPKAVAEDMQKTNPEPYFGDRIDSDLIQRYKPNVKDGYKSQFPQPESESLATFLNLRSAEEEYFPIAYEVKALGQVNWKEDPNVEECWLAQEDLWVRREVLNCFVTALHTIGKFTEVRELLV